MKRSITLIAACTILATAGHESAQAKPTTLSQADAATAADAFQAAWTSSDVGKIESYYAKDMVSFSPIAAPLATSWDVVHKRVEDFVALKMDKMEVPDRRIQILDDNNFVVSGTGRMTSAAGSPERSVRFTHVYHKQADGTWKIVNTHRSFAPKEQ